MTDKLHCPFCGMELERCSYLSKGITNPVFVCRNRKCKFVDKIIDSEIWQALIDGKKAQDALKEIVNFFDTECGKDDLYFYNLIDDNIAKYREITSITKREI